MFVSVCVPVNVATVESIAIVAVVPEALESIPVPPAIVSMSVPIAMLSAPVSPATLVLSAIAV